jgi:hypothetical protein
LGLFDKDRHSDLSAPYAVFGMEIFQLTVCTRVEAYAETIFIADISVAAVAEKS